MQMQVVTLFPEMVNVVAEYGVVGRAVGRSILSIGCQDPRSYTDDAHRTVDDRPYGGGPGMVMMVEPLRAAIQNARQSVEKANGEAARVVYLSPRGRKLDQTGLKELSQQMKSLITSLWIQLRKNQPYTVAHAKVMRSLEMAPSITERLSHHLNGLWHLSKQSIRVKRAMVDARFIV